MLNRFFGLEAQSFDSAQMTCFFIDDYLCHPERSRRIKRVIQYYMYHYLYDDRVRLFHSPAFSLQLLLHDIFPIPRYTSTLFLPLVIATEREDSAAQINSSGDCA